MPNPPTDPWEISEEGFPTDGSDEEKLRFLIGYALLAPSSHNSQPWIFRLEDGDTLQLCADKTRVLPVADPDGRELIMSCGTALFHLRMAVRHFGHQARVRTFVEPKYRDLLDVSRGLPDLIARVRLGTPEEPTDEEEELFRAIPRRHTNRHAFEDREVPEEAVEALVAAADQEGAWFHVVEGEGERERLADLITEGDRIQGADKRFRRELASWLHSNRTRSRDGLPGYAFGMGDLESYVGPLVVRTFDWGDGQAARDRQLAEGSPVLAILGTDEDSAPAWLRAGEALDRVLLAATARGIDASFLNQPVEVAELRPHVADLVPSGRHPQMIIRMGYGPEVEPTPRRRVEDVLDEK